MLKPYIKLVSATVFLAGLAVIAGYYFKFASLVQILPGVVPMAFNSALSFIFAAVALRLVILKVSRKAFYFAIAASLLPILTILEYLLETDLGVDTLFASNFIIVETAHPGRMAPLTAICFLLFNGGLVLLVPFKFPKSAMPFLSATCGVIVTLVGSLAFLSYVFDVQSLFGWGYFPRMAIHTTICFILLGTALTGAGFFYLADNLADIDTLRRRLLGFSIAGTAFVGIFSSNVVILPTFSRLEKTERLTVAENVYNKGLIVSQWASGIEEVLKQISSRTVVRKLYEQYANNLITQELLQERVQDDLEDGLKANSNVAGVCRSADAAKCIIKAGAAIPTANLQGFVEDQSHFLKGPYQLDGEFYLIARIPVHIQNSTVEMADYYLVRVTSLVTALTSHAHKRLGVESFVAFPNGDSWNVLRSQGENHNLEKVSGTDYDFSEIFKRQNSNPLDTYETDASAKVNFLYGYATVPEIGWLLIDRVDANTVYSGIKAQMAVALLLVGLVIFVGALAMYFLLKPLGQMIYVHAASLEERIQKKTREVQQTTEFKSQFLANMSHEIRTPLTAILGFADQLSDPDITPSTANDSLFAIIRNGKHLLELTNDILDISKVEAGKLSLEEIECSPLEIAQEVVELLNQKALEKEIRLQLNVVYPIPRFVVLDPTRLRQIFVNLVGNAIKFTEKGHVGLKIEFLSQSQFLGIEVSDTGVGMSPEQIERLFTAFNQADATTTRRFGGTGLGLSITKELVRLFKGEINVESTPTVGSRFCIKLPVSKLSEDLLFIAPAQRSATVVSKVKNDLELTGSVLLVEDSEDIRSMVSYLVKRTGAALKTATNGQEAVTLASSEKFDLIFMDMQMPVLDGYSATRLLRQNGYTFPIVGLTANTINGGLKLCIEAGCDDALGKPFERKDLFGTLERYLKPAVSIAKEEVIASLDISEFAPIRRQFLKRMPLRVSALEDGVKNENWDQVAEETHRLIAAGLFGCADISETARNIERLILTKDSVEILKQLNVLRELTFFHQEKDGFDSNHPTA